MPNAVGDAQGSDNISVMWQEHYSHIFNMVSESNCKSLHADLCKEDSLFDNDMIVTSNEIEDIIEDLAYNKSPGLDGISSEHIKFAGQQLPVLLSILMSAILVHGYVPKSMLKYVIVSLFQSLNIKTNVSVPNVTTDLYANLMYLQKWLKKYCIVVWRIISNLRIINLGSSKNMVQKCVFLY